MFCGKEQALVARFEQSLSLLLRSRFANLRHLHLLPPSLHPSPPPNHRSRRPLLPERLQPSLLSQVECWRDPVWVLVENL